MFTGLVQTQGKLTNLEARNGLTVFTVRAALRVEDVTLGASVMHSGVCLTVVDSGQCNDSTDVWFKTEAVPETLDVTTLSAWKTGDLVNIEPSLRMGDELGGHYVFGHVDCLATVAAITPEGESYRVRITTRPDFAHFFAQKGSVAVDGVSLTLADVFDDGAFEVCIIPHTWDVTTLNQLSVGSKVNIEIDMLARYVARMVATGVLAQSPKDN